MSNPIDRRHFVQTTLAASAVALAWRPTFASARSLQKLRVGSVGVGGMGASDLGQIASHANVEIAAICDIDMGRLNAAGEKFPKAARFTDWREMLASMGDALDAVSVSTPDHMHAPITMSALDMGKHVYAQKPLTHSVNEGRAIALKAKQNPGLATQMGTQIASYDHKRQAMQLLAEGSIVGKVTSIHGWTDRPVRYWAQGKLRPQGSNPIPNDIAWYNWLGVAPDRPYLSKVYHPFAWRGFRDFGCGALGDMACHIIDTPLQAMDLLVPTDVTVECTDSTADMFPTKETVRFTLKGNKYTGGKDIPFVWYDGGILPTQAELGLPADFKIPQNTVAVVGEEGTFLIPYEGSVVSQLFKGGQSVDFKKPELADPGRNHWHHWVECCAGNDKTQTNFVYAGTLCEMLSLGAFGSLFPNQKLVWDAKSMQVTNNDGANRFVTRVYRDGWGVPMPTGVM
ncbi:MAG: Gfo/Idh/MocA family protein [Phycisphaerales bacterium]